MAPTIATAPNGVLQISTAAINKPGSTPKNPGGKSAAPRLKIVIRRLAPGLTEAEFKEAVGDEWKVGGGKVDWLVYKAGKVSKDLAKPSRPSRAYLRVTEQSLLVTLAEKVKQTSFNDAKNTSKDPCLIGPPIVEFAPYMRVPGGRRARHDARQGLIDQDTEFKDFLESLTNPITKPNPADGIENMPPKEEIKTTPLIEHIREKKAQKDKPASKSSGKHARNESKEGKGDHGGDKKILSKGGKEGASEKGKKNRSEKANKESVKILNKEAASQGSAASGETAAPPAEKKRPNASIAAKVLQRDLGIGPAAGRRRGSKRELASETAAKAAETKAAETPAPAETEKQAASSTQQGEKSTESAPKKERHRHTRAERRAHQAAKAEKAAAEQKAAGGDSKPAAAAPAPTILKKPATASQPAAASASPAATPKNPPTAPKGASRRASSTAQSQASAQSATAAASQQGKAAPVASTAAASSTPAQPGRQAFLKHANASQGITEPLIEEALSAFGKIEKVEIDKRKGFAYVDFADAESLQKAIAASPVKVAQGAVQVLERRERVGGKLAPSAGANASAGAGSNAPAQAQGQQQQQQTSGGGSGGNAPARGGGQGSFRGGRGRGRGGGPAGRGRAGQETPAQQQQASSASAPATATAAPQAPVAVQTAAPAPVPPPPDAGA